MGDIGAVNKGFIKNVNTGAIKEFLLNPTSFTDEVTINFSEIDAGGSPGYKHQYIGRTNRAIELRLYLQSRDPSKVEDFKNFLESFIPVTRFKAPPLALFCFGTYIKKCMVLSVRREWSRFNSELRVTEMSIQLSLKEVA